ncbi:MAG TPA: FKBP-type peptidyl-prolyl cis-trans isomerase [Actinomycetota bacterium]|nr:FKBP-type peptidyl-prolyl cis-trans isomerase [Actinomycetota bacterium]
MPDGEPPGELLVQDVVTGEGEVLREGDTFTVHYVGVSWQRREIFDRTWPGEPASFGWDGVIDGWRRGIAGMRVGGRRGLVVPPELGYDDGETMIFVVDLLGVQRPAEVGAGAGEAPAP